MDSTDERPSLRYRTDLRKVPTYTDDSQSEIAVKIKGFEDSVAKAQENMANRDARMGRRPERGRQTHDDPFAKT
jgi:hypothetical protein